MSANLTVGIVDIGRGIQRHAVYRGGLNVAEFKASADANLFASAPDMLTALDAMVRQYAGSDDGYPGNSPAHMARAAIAKARGGAS